MTIARIARLRLIAAALLLLAGASTPATADPDSDAYRRDIESQRAERLERLKAPDAWLALIGRHWLVPGRSTVGSAADNAVVLAAGPARLGALQWATDGTVTFTLADGVDAAIDGAGSARSARLIGDGQPPAPPTEVRFGSRHFHLIERGERKALRVFDPQSPIRRGFTGLDYFPVAPAWRVVADWQPYDPPREIRVTNQLGQTTVEKVAGRAVFIRDGVRHELTPLPDASENGLFFVFSDRTAPRETYGGARFLTTPGPADGKVVLDFNLARNPPCAFTPYTTCPLAPKENRLAIAVTAGEKKYRGAIH